jgi:hypothetical protein
VQLRSEVQDRVAPLHALGDGIRITDIAFYELVSAVTRYRL